MYLLNVLRHLARTTPWRLRLVCRTDQAVDSLAAQAAEVSEVERLDVVRPQDLLRLRRLVRDSDAVHLNLAFPSGKYQLAAALVTELGRRPLVVTHHLALTVSAQWAVFIRRLGRAAVRHITISDQQRAFLIERFGFPPERVVTVHNGIDASVFKPRAHAGDATGRASECITVARLSPQKGLDVLLEAMVSVPRARLTLVGDGELREELVRRAAASGLQDRFELTGALSRDEVAGRLGAADVYVLPSRYEGGPPLALMEAMACGLPCVATEVTGVRELIADESLGRVVPVGDPAAIAAAIGELILDPTLRTAIGARSRQAVLDGFTIEGSMERTESILAEVVALGG